MLTLTLKRFDRTKQYIEIEHKSGDVIKICLDKVKSGNALVCFEADKKDFSISRKKIQLDEGYKPTGEFVRVVKPIIDKAIKRMAEDSISCPDQDENWNG